MVLVQDPLTGNAARVNNENEVAVRAVTSGIALHRVEEGEGFNINTGLINLGTAVSTAVLYIKNTDINSIVVTSATVFAGATTGGTLNELTVQQVGNFDASSNIITGGTDGIAFNRNVGTASRTFNGTIKIGGDGLSFTNGVAAQQTTESFPSTRDFDLTTIIPVGGEVGVSVTPPTGNTSMNFMLSINFHVLESL